MAAKEHNPNRIKAGASPSGKVFNAFNTVFFLLFATSCVFPFYYLFINTISENTLVQRGLINFFPRGIHFDNYRSLLEAGDVVAAFLVSVSRTLLGTLLMVIASSFVGYLVTKKEMWQRRFWYRFLIITMYFNAGLIPGYLNMVMLGLTDNFLVYILPAVVAPFNIILVKTYVESIPAELEESALMDGAGTLRIFTRIIWPLSIPILATIAIFGAVGQWNSFTDSLIYMQSTPGLYTLQHRLYIYLNTNTNLGAVLGGGSVDSAMAAQLMQNTLNAKVIKYTISMVTIIPILMVYPFMTRYFQKGIMLGAVKG